MKPLSKDDRRSVLVLIVVIALCFILFPFVDRMTGLSDGTEKGVISKRERKHSAKENTDETDYFAVPEKESELFAFDPNTADSTQLLRLGLRPWQVKNIYKYRAAGGRYRKPSDFARLYGLTLKQFQRLEPYIRIEKEVMAADVYGTSFDEARHQGKTIRKDSVVSSTNATAKSPYPQKSLSAVYPKKIKPVEKVNINSADTIALQTIPGIGRYFARRIVRFREQLGGFADVAQLLEIEGFPESSLAYASIGNSSAVKKIKINQLDAWKLSRHPYLLYVQAKDIVAYRNMNGNITSLAQLESIKSFTPSDVKRLAPYVDFDSPLPVSPKKGR